LTVREPSRLSCRLDGTGEVNAIVPSRRYYSVPVSSAVLTVP